MNRVISVEDPGTFRKPWTGRALATGGSGGVPRRSGIGLLLEPLRLVYELVARNLYWRCAAFRRLHYRYVCRRRPAIQESSREDLRAYLKEIGIVPGALVLLHTRIVGVRIASDAVARAEDYGTTAETLLSDVLDLLGPSGTLAMPTNAKYQKEELRGDASLQRLIRYDPARSHCSVGLVNELFRRQSGVERSLFPFNMLAVHGPLADELLRDNLNERKPSPHGVDSGYYRICQHNGLMVSIGVPLADCFTLAHVVEEVRPDWPIGDFMMERRYEVVLDGRTTEWTVRLTREEYSRFCCCRRKMGRDLVAEGVIHEGRIGSLRVDWARAAEVYEFFWRKTEKHPYPYYGLWLSRIPWGRPK